MTWSYCSHTQRLEHSSGVPISFSSAAATLIGGVTSRAWITGSAGEATCGRS